MQFTLPDCIDKMITFLKRNKFKRISLKKIFLLVLCVVLIKGAVFLCSSPPDYAGEREKREEAKKATSSQPKPSVSSNSFTPHVQKQSENKEEGQQNREDMILAKMEKNIMKGMSNDAIDNLPKPQTILKSAVGPVKIKRNAPKKVEKVAGGIKLLVVARDKAGYPVIQQFLNHHTHFFQHGEPGSDPHTIANLYNCVLEPAILDRFSTAEWREFGDSGYFKSCLLDSRAVCNDPLSYESACSRYAHQIIRFRHLNLTVVETILANNPDIRAVFLVRDPRAIFLDQNGAGKPAKYCTTLSQDMKFATNLASSYPRQFAISRYEVLAREPQAEMEKILQNFGIPNLRLEAVTWPPVEEEADAWSREANQLARITQWKQKLTLKQINNVEDQCSDALSRLEYHLVGTIT